jgi:hypothetical protein
MASHELFSTKNFIENGKFDLNKIHQTLNVNSIEIINNTSVPGWNFNANIYKSNDEMGMFPKSNESKYFACLIGPEKFINQKNIYLTTGKYKLSFQRCKMYGTEPGNIYIGIINDDFVIKTKVIENISTERWVYESFNININKNDNYSLIIYTKDNNYDVAFGIANVKLLKTNDKTNINIKDSFISIKEPLPFIQSNEKISEETNNVKPSENLQNEMNNLTKENKKKLFIEKVKRRGLNTRKELTERLQMGEENKKPPIFNKSIKYTNLNYINLDKLLKFKEKQIKYYEKNIEDIKKKLEIAENYPRSLTSTKNYINFGEKKLKFGEISRLVKRSEVSPFATYIYNINGKYKGKIPKFINKENSLTINNLTELLKEQYESIEKTKEEIKHIIKQIHKMKQKKSRLNKNSKFV